MPLCCLSDVIGWDACIRGDRDCKKLRRALELGKENKTQLKLRTRRLDVAFVRPTVLGPLLDELDHKVHDRISLQDELKLCPSYLPHQNKSCILVNLFLQDVEAICARHMTMRCDQLAVLAPTLCRFNSLSGLDLARNNIDLVHAENHQGADFLGEMLANLPVLARLNLSNSRLTNHLESVLNKTAGLSSLSVCDCSLSAKDINFLATSHHVNTLKCLDIGFNDLGENFNDFLHLLGALKNQLAVLETPSSSFEKHHLTLLFQTASKQLHHLRYLDVSGNETVPHEECIRRILDMAGLSELASFEVLVVPYPAEVGSAFDSRKQLCEKLATLLLKRFPNLAVAPYIMSLVIAFR